MNTKLIRIYEPPGSINTHFKHIQDKKTRAFSNKLYVKSNKHNKKKTFQYRKQANRKSREEYKEKG